MRKRAPFSHLHALIVVALVLSIAGPSAAAPRPPGGRMEGTLDPTTA